MGASRTKPVLTRRIRRRRKALYILPGLTQRRIQGFCWLQSSSGNSAPLQCTLCSAREGAYLVHRDPSTKYRGLRDLAEENQTDLAEEDKLVLAAVLFSSPQVQLALPLLWHLAFLASPESNQRVSTIYIPSISWQPTQGLRKQFRTHRWNQDGCLPPSWAQRKIGSSCSAEQVCQLPPF